MNLSHAIQNPIFKLITHVVSDKKQQTFVIGGFVRDLLLERPKVKDIDIVTEGSGIELALSVADKLHSKPKVSVFKRFGTAMIHVKDYDVEFVGARKESYSFDSRKPFVETGTIEDDQNRRDFTINTLAISLNEESFGELVDPFNGLEDLKRKIIRTPLDPEITYSDDPLRMIRAIRFATQLNFIIESSSFLAIKENAERFDILSKERIMDEFNKIMMSPQPSIGLKLLYEANLLQRFLPELTDLQGIEEVEGQKHKDNFFHTLEVVDNISKTTNNLWLRWAALLHDIGKARTKKFDKKIGWTFHSHEFVGSKMVLSLFKRLKLPLGDPLKYVQKLVQNSSRPISLITDDASDSALRRLLFDMGDDLEDLFLLCKADITTKNIKKQTRFKQNFDYVEEKIKEVEEKDKIRNFQPPITGHDIMEAFEIIEGKQIGTIKEAIKEGILEGTITNDYKNSYNYMLQLGKKLNLKRKN
ncbi:MULTISPECIES: CCA tRNA nucleotidyltransferase [unclassified Apibacter]|uniref:CCA tRNA nucleotidyltransferase n=1 Tax=unclassified Apibacter TaxID=2630820 RepID=UPI0013237FC1|nr:MULTISPECIES: HD domain-containing protein [unclassified Apibacter]MCX8677844.1 HD domain-containing protein [Apibacter sp. B3919]MXO25204.1 HD domain-containing protein [Apibacter sp. B3924]MXO27407.1 HD domain-containing protein [Apibacter sp. B3813]MXO29220.1 HD domain-containing protein [Apibacter sp. B3913]MXO31277.1 HD domain-containing protein [Apibacter sp. B3912]